MRMIDGGLTLASALPISLSGTFCGEEPNKSQRNVSSHSPHAMNYRFIEAKEVKAGGGTTHSAAIHAVCRKDHSGLREIHGSMPNQEDLEGVSTARHARQSQPRKALLMIPSRSEKEKPTDLLNAIEVEREREFCMMRDCGPIPS